MSYLFTSESVSPGHPDKVADIIADTIVGYIIERDPTARVASEVFVAGNNIIIGGEVTTNIKVNYEDLVYQALEYIGYNDNPNYTDTEVMKPQNVKVQVLLNEQSPDINQGVDQEDGETGAGDQGIMFGYADNETENFMPSAITYSKIIMEDVYNYALNNPQTLGIDIKTQVTMDYGTKENFENSKSQSIHTIVCSAPSKMDIKDLREFIEKLIRNNPKLPQYMLKDTIFHINPTGKYINHSPLHDSGLTGRKLIVDTFGGYSPIGGGAQSSKDYTKVDRSGLYAARWIAKNIVASGYSTKAIVQISYAIGVAKPMSIAVDTMGTYTSLDDNELSKLVIDNFSLTPNWIRDKFKLDKPSKDNFLYEEVAARGQVGNPSYPWEKLEENFLK